MERLCGRRICPEKMLLLWRLKALEPTRSFDLLLPRTGGCLALKRSQPPDRFLRRSLPCAIDRGLIGFAKASSRRGSEDCEISFLCCATGASRSGRAGPGLCPWPGRACLDTSRCQETVASPASPRRARPVPGGKQTLARSNPAWPISNNAARPTRREPAAGRQNH